MLWRQALRSVWRGRRSYMACVTLMAVGIGMYVSFNLLFENLSAAMQSYYIDYRFADVFARVEGIPLNAVERLESLPGIARAQGDILADVRVERESPKIITLRLSSYNPNEPERLNDFLLVEGTLPGPDGVLLGEGFAAAGDVKVGDSIDLVIGGRKISPVVTGLVQSPEYVYAIPDAGQLFPDEEAFGFGYMQAGQLGILSGKAGIADALSFTLDEGVEYNDIAPLLEEALAPYGFQATYDREGQASHAMLKQEVDSLGAMATSVPMIFIFMAVIILYIMLGRVIRQERTQIGTLKAFGFAKGRILAHYLVYGAAAGSAGGLLGLGMGLWLTNLMTTIYLEYFTLPAIQVPPNPVYLAGGFLIGLLAGLLGAVTGAWGVLRLHPAEAMRPQSPPVVRGDVIGKLPFLRVLLASHGYMAVRNIGRNRFRSGFIAVGLAFAFALTAFMSSFGEMFDALMLDQFTKVELYNIKVSLKSPVPPETALESALALDGVRRAETVLELPVELRNAHLKETVGLTALSGESELYKLYDSESRVNMDLPPGGVILSDSLATKLGTARGGLLVMKTTYSDEEFALPVLGIVHSSLGAGAYIRHETLWQLLGMAPAANALILDAADTQAVKEALKEAGNVAAVADHEDTKKIYTDLLDTYLYMFYMLDLAGVGVALAIIRSTATISLSERKREYATMRVMGMHPREIAGVVGFEYWVLLAAAVPLGIFLTRGLKVMMAGMINNDLFSIPLYTAPQSYLVAMALCAAAVIFSNRSAAKKIARFDMVEVLKERE